MTLIISCITKDFGIIAGDTQSTTRGVKRDGKKQKSVELKVRSYSNYFMMGIMGEWGHFHTTKEAKGLAWYINDYDVLSVELLKRDIKNKSKHLIDFLKDREFIEATSIYVERNKEGFNLEAVSNIEEINDVITKNTDDYKMVFNEPFFSTDNSYIDNKIDRIIQEYGLNDSLTDMLFVINNVILEVISNGRNFTISKKGTSTDIENTVGGYITIQVMTNSGTHFFKYLGSPYNTDTNCLLDKTTNPFSNYLDNNIIIRYIDNLGMLLKNISTLNNDEDVKASIVELIPKQVLHIDKLKIIEKPDLNKIIEYINQKYDLGIANIVLPKDEQVSGDICLTDILINTDEDITVDVNFLKRFL